MECRIEKTPGKKLVGMSAEMSFADDKTFELWRTFMPIWNAIPNRTSNDLISMQLYPEGFFKRMSADAVFTKWAAVEVSEFHNLPDTLHRFILPAGSYAVFIHRGSIVGAPAAFKYIFEDWLPSSPYQLDNRPHFELLGSKYRGDHPDSEEEIWIPVQAKL